MLAIVPPVPVPVYVPVLPLLEGWARMKVSVGTGLKAAQNLPEQRLVLMKRTKGDRLGWAAGKAVEGSHLAVGDWRRQGCSGHMEVQKDVGFELR